MERKICHINYLLNIIALSNAILYTFNNPSPFRFNKTNLKNVLTLFYYRIICLARVVYIFVL